MAPTRLNWANVLRGAAAVSVVVGAHLISAIWGAPEYVAASAGLSAEYADVGDPPVWATAIGSVHWSAAGVCLFFLLSGLVVSRSLLKQSRGGFTVGRLFRILPTYAVAYFVVSAVVIFNGRVTGVQNAYSIGDIWTGLVPGLNILLGTTAVPNGVVWTLLVELAFYTLCVLFYRRLIEKWWAALAVAIACVPVFVAVKDTGVRSFFPVGADGILDLIQLVTPFLPVVMIGVALSADGLRPGPRKRLLLVVVSLSALFFYMASQPGVYFVIDRNLPYRITYLVVIIGFLAIWRWSTDWRTHPVADFFADISYPMYVSHLAVGSTIVLVLLHAGVHPLLATALAFAVVILIGWLLHLAVEQPTHRLGRKWSRRLSSSVSAHDPQREQSIRITRS